MCKDTKTQTITVCIVAFIGGAVVERHGWFRFFQFLGLYFIFIVVLTCIIIARFGTLSTNPSWYQRNTGTSSSFQAPRSSSIPAATSDRDKVEEDAVSSLFEDTAQIGFVYKCPSCAAIFENDDIDAFTRPSPRSFQVPTQEKAQDCAELGVAIVIVLLFMVYFT